MVVPSKERREGARRVSHGRREQDAGGDVGTEDLRLLVTQAARHHERESDRQRERIDEVYQRLHALERKIAMYIGGAMVIGAVIGYVIRYVMV